MLNMIVMSGRLCADPELQYTESEVARLNFTIAVEKNFANADGKREASFIPCVAWRGDAEFIANYFKKGAGITIQGELEQRSWQDPGTDEKRSMLQVVVGRAFFPVADPKSTEASVAKG